VTADDEAVRHGTVVMAARKQYLLRIDPDLWAEVEKWAADELRSVNAQVEYILRDAVRRRRGGRTAGDAHATGGGAGPHGGAGGGDGR
jgi:hypothetical protein